MPELEFSIYLRAGLDQDRSTKIDTQFVFIDNGTYTAEVSFPSGEYLWLVADESWNKLYCGAKGYEDDVVPSYLDVNIDELNVGVKAECGNYKTFDSFKTLFSGLTYQFTINFSKSPEHPEISVIEI